MTTSPLTTRRPVSALKRYWPQYLAISPFYILFLVFGLFPIVFSLYISLHDWDGIGTMKWVGLAQFQYLLVDPRFWNAVSNTFIIWFMSTIPMLFFALVIAVLLHQNIRSKGFYRVAYFMPNVTSMVAMALVFGSVFSDTFGIVNSALKSLSLDTVPWLTSDWGIKTTIAVMVIWRFTGYNAIIYLAGLQAISSDVYDAAKMDGASSWHEVWDMTIPQMKKIFMIVTLLSVIWAFRSFTVIWTLTQGNPFYRTDISVTYLYKLAFKNLSFGQGFALAFATFVLLSVFSILYTRVLRSEEMG